MKQNTSPSFSLAGLWLSLSVVLVAVFAVCCTGSKSGGLEVYPKAMGAADEASAIQSLRTVGLAETQLKATSGAYGSFDALVKAGLLDQRFAGATPNLKGYRLSIRSTDSDYSINADPQTTETQPTTGSRHFYLDSSDNNIHINGTQTASKSDPTL
jgi:hypothetical protein